MEGTLVVQEDRKNVNKFKNWYKEKIVDTKIASGSEKVFSKVVDFSIGVNKFKDTVGTSIMAFIPEATIFIPLVKVASGAQRKIMDLSKNLVIKTKRGIEAKFIGVDGSNEDISIPDLKVDEVSKDVATSITDVGTAIKEVEGVGKSR